MRKLIICLLMICLLTSAYAQGWSDYFKKEPSQLEGLYLFREENSAEVLFLFTPDIFENFEEEEDDSYYSFELSKENIMELEGTNSFLINSSGIIIDEYLYKNSKTYYTKGGLLSKSAYFISVSQDVNPRLRGIYRITNLNNFSEVLKTQPEDFILTLDAILDLEEILETQKTEWQKQFSIYTPFLNGLIITRGSDTEQTFFVLRRNFDVPYTYVFWLRDDEVQEIQGGVILAINETTTVYKSYFDDRGLQHDPIFDFSNGIYYLELESTDTLESTVIALFASLNSPKLYFDLEDGEIDLSVPSAFKKHKLKKH